MAVNKFNGVAITTSSKINNITVSKINGQSVASSAAWYDDLELGEQATSANAEPTFAYGGTVTLPSGGTVTKLRVGLRFVFADGNVRAAIYTTTGALVANGSGSVSVLSSGGHNQVVEITGLNATVSSGDVYVVFTADTGNIHYAYTGSQTGYGKNSFTKGYADMPVADLSAFGTADQRFVCGCYLT